MLIYAFKIALAIAFLCENAVEAIQISSISMILTVNDRKYVFHFRPKPKPKSEKHLALGRIPKPKVKIQGVLA